MIEIVVAMGIFALLTGSLSSIFVQALQSQKKTLAIQDVLGQTSYILDYMSRAIRMAKKDIDGACITAKLNYQRTATGIKFLNYDGICQEFFLDSGDFKLKESKASASPVDLTSANLKINSFNINLSGESQDDTIQPKITLFLDIEGKNQVKMKIQTTVSQRNLDIQR